MKQVSLAIACLVLSGCIFESEKACYKAHREMLEDYLAVNTLELRKYLHDKEFRDIFMERVAHIMGQQNRLQNLYETDAISVCDFYLDSATLVRK